MDLLRGACEPVAGAPWASDGIGRRLEEKLIAALPPGLGAAAQADEGIPAAEAEPEREWEALLTRLGERHPDAFGGSEASAGEADEAGFVLWMRGKIRHLRDLQGSPRSGSAPAAPLAQLQQAPPTGAGDETETD